jgi:hypothetical protein
MGPGRCPRRGTGGSAARAGPRARSRATRRGASPPPPRRRCSSARTGSAPPGAATGPLGTGQRAGAGPAPPGPGARLSRPMRSRSSRSTSACSRPTRSALATTTRSSPGPLAGSSLLKLSRMRRRARFRSTALPRRRLTASPRRSTPSRLGAATRRNRRPSSLLPRLKTASNSAPVLRRCRGRSRAGIAGATPPSRGDSLAPLLAPPLEDELAPLAPHAHEEAVRALATAVVRLERPLHVILSDPGWARAPRDKPKRRRVVEHVLSCQRRARPGRRRGLSAPGACATFGRLRTPTETLPPCFPLARFSTTVEISVQKRYVRSGGWRHARQVVCFLVVVSNSCNTPGPWHPPGIDGDAR